jgi:hypothetical protein
MFCEGGLFACAVCASFEGATTDDCPGRRMTAEESDAVYAGELNFRAGEWRQECCQIRRPVYDIDAYMAEHGYRREGINAAGNPNWVKPSEGTTP